MTLQQIHYAITISEQGSFNKDNGQLNILKARLFIKVSYKIFVSMSLFIVFKTCACIVTSISAIGNTPTEKQPSDFVGILIPEAK